MNPPTQVVIEGFSTVIIQLSLIGIWFILLCLLVWGLANRLCSRLDELIWTMKVQNEILNNNDDEENENDNSHS